VVAETSPSETRLMGEVVDFQREGAREAAGSGVAGQGEGERDG
jgi:hypothetical protein